MRNSIRLFDLLTTCTVGAQFPCATLDFLFFARNCSAYLPQLGPTKISFITINETISLDKIKETLNNCGGRSDGTEYTVTGLVAEKEHRIQVSKNSRDKWIE